jgi:uncharacterized cofD-like protein
MNSPRVVALGGGHGLFSILTALRAITSDITAIVTVADNGGSSGRLRDEFPIFPPGDLRMALAALCADDDWGKSWAQIMQYRFASNGPLDGHAVGNLLLAALWNRDEDPVQGLDRVGALLKVVGRVLPMAAQPLDIEATFLRGGERSVVRGQIEVAIAQGVLESLRLIPENPDARIEAIAAIDSADWITMGPGSWISSVLPHLLVPQQLKALESSSAKKVLLLNLSASAEALPLNQGSEFSGRSSLDHYGAVALYAPALHFDYVIADHSTLLEPLIAKELETKVSTQGGELIAADLRSNDSDLHHDPKKLALVFSHIGVKSLIG